MQTRVAFDPRLLRRAVRMILADAGLRDGEISVAIVDDQRIHELNRTYLDHDYATDVLSFVLEPGGPDAGMIGEIIASGDTAAREAEHYDWSTAEELLLYVVHGALHLAGHDDRTKVQAAAMRRAESEYLARLGVVRPVATSGRKTRPKVRS
ncbi:MAG: rRNA maturation RNase YbeY [Pirellulales bacterium]